MQSITTVYHFRILKYRLQIYYYIESRKRVYCDLYIQALTNRSTLDNKALELFDCLKKRVRRGEKLLIIEVDGPDYADSEPYCNIQKGILGDDGVCIIDATKENIIKMLNNPDRPFGHGYVISSLIQKLGEKWLR